MLLMSSRWPGRMPSLAICTAADKFISWPVRG
jgi:hypothetical protein